MKHILFCILLVVSLISFSQENIQTYKTKFELAQVTYNGSDNPNECWESVAWGIFVKQEKGKGKWFFGMPYEPLIELEKKVGDAEMEVEIIFHEPYDDSGEQGDVISIRLNGEVIYKR